MISNLILDWKKINFAQLLLFLCYYFVFSFHLVNCDVNRKCDKNDPRVENSESHSDPRTAV